MATENVLIDPSADELAGAVEENLYALFRAATVQLDGQLVEGDALCFHHAFPTNPMFKGVWRALLTIDDADAAITETVDWFRARLAPFAFWWTGARTTPPDLGNRLLAHGFAPFEIDAPVMTADLTELREELLTRVPTGFAIEEVADATALAEFERVLVEGFGIPDWAARGWTEATARIGIGRTPWRLFLGRLDGAPVASNLLFTGGGVASVYAIATVPAHRGRGIGGAITLGPLLAARDQGYRHAALFSTPEGYRVYERIGFRDTGARVSRYLWRNG